MRVHIMLFSITLSLAWAGDRLRYPIVDTGQVRCYNSRTECQFPKKGAAFFGQDAHYAGNQPKYRDNGDGTITDLVTELTWQKDPGDKQTLEQALRNVKRCRLAGRTDWRIPSIKELYSLILFTGTDPATRGIDTASQKPFIDTRHFKFSYGDPRKRERLIDSQYGTSTRYVSTTMFKDATMFGVNFADGRIKGYPLVDRRRRTAKKFYFIYVRGNSAYGRNMFRDNGDGTITDKATGLIWMQVDSARLKAGRSGDGKLNWCEALAWAEDLNYAGHSDWRLPSVKELQSIVDYSRSPETTKSAAINPLFKVSKIKDEAGRPNFANYWSNTTHVSHRGAEAGAYVAFGESLGWMMDQRTGKRTLLDVHGAGSQRSDPKSGDPARFPYGRGPQGDVIRIYNLALCVRGGMAKPVTSSPVLAKSPGQRERNQQSDSPATRFTQRLDKDGDGKVSRDEFDGPKHHFDHMDKNRDGFLEGNECPKGPPPRLR